MQLLSFEQWMSTVFVKALGVTFAHSIWQGTLALIICYLLLAAAKKATAIVRYNLILTVLAVLACTLVATFILQFINQPAQAVLTFRFNTLQSIIESNGAVAVPVVTQSKQIVSSVADFFNLHVDLFISVWFIVFCVKWLRLSLSMNYVKRITLYGSSPAADEWRQTFLSLKHRIGISRAIAFLQSDIIKVPMTAGFLKPVIIVPASMLLNLPVDTVKSILLHELAHIRRHDYLVNLLQASAETIFFFNPFILKISSLLKEEREACCDAVAVDALESKVTYVNALVSFGEFTNSQPYSALAFGGYRNSLLSRVKRILFNQNKKPGVMEKSILACSLVLLVGLAIFSTAKGTEEKLKTVFINPVGAFTADTVPAKTGEKLSRREQRKVEKRMKEEKVREDISNDDLRAALDELAEEQERLNEKRQQLIERRKQEIDRDLRQRGEDEVDVDVDIQEISEKAQRDAMKAQKQLKESEIFNKDLQNALADAQVQIQKTIKLQNGQRIQLQQYLNDSLTVQLKKMRFDTSNGEVDDILNFIEKNNIAKAKEVTFFSLDENEFKVNGKVQPSNFHNQLKEKYVGKKDDHINYMKMGDNISISIQRNDSRDEDRD